MGGYQVAKAKEQGTGPGLVFVQGGTFTMGQTEEDVMGDWNNIPRRVTVNFVLHRPHRGGQRALPRVHPLAEPRV
jgi:hypothetical protein